MPISHSIPSPVVVALLALALCGMAPRTWALDANLASQAELESIRGIGPAIAARIIAERGRGPFLDLDDLRDRVRGVGAASLRRMAESGLEVGRPAGMAGGIAGAEPGAGAATGTATRSGAGRARGWVRDLPAGADQPRRPSSPGMTGW